MRSRLSPRATATLVARLVTLLWSSSYILVKIGLQSLPPLTFAGLRYFIGFSALALPAVQRRTCGTSAPNVAA
jgi:drug/metabolite transporter (DMT)-like permease